MKYLKEFLAIIDEYMGTLFALAFLICLIKSC
jgi:hypothetical protein